MLFDAVVGDAVFRAASLAEDGLVIDPPPADQIGALLADLALKGGGLKDSIDDLLACGQVMASSKDGQCG